MEITVIELKYLISVFEKILEDKLTREEASDWANSLQLVEDEGVLNYSPNESENQIWEGIQFLQGIDLKDSPTTYLHNLEDIEKVITILRVTE